MIDDIKDKLFDESILGNDIYQYLIFKIASEEYALDVLSVQEIVGVATLTPVPGSSDYVVGLINLRGSILHVIDLRKRLSIERVAHDSFDNDVIIVLSTSARRFGVLADVVTDVASIRKDHIYDTPIESISGLKISSVIKIDDRVVMVLPVDEVVIADESIVREK